MSWSDGGMKARLDLKLTQKLIMTPQLQQAIKLLQLSRLELNQVIDQELMENPLLEDVAAEEEASSPADGEMEKKEEESPEKAEELDLKWEDYYVDEDRDEAGSYSAASSEERPSYDQTLSKATSLEDHLLWQLGLSSVKQREKEIGTVLIGNIDENGYLSTPLEEIAVLVGAS